MNNLNQANTNTLGTTTLRNLGGTLAVNVSCFVKGTRITTESGEVAVEQLQIGDAVMTLENGAKRIKWIGKTFYEAEIVNSSPYVRPVIVRAGALGDSLPSRDLNLSPQHALYLDGVLVPVVGLINGQSILRDMSGTAIEYFHVELEDHDVIIAEGAAVETYIDTDTRSTFDNASEYDRLYGAAATGMVECAPRVEEGYLLSAMRKRFAAAAGVSVPTATQGRLIGNVEAIFDGLLVGWAQDADNVDSAVEVEVLVDGESIGRALANRYRGDLFSAGLGSGNCCYTLALPASVTSIDQVTVRRVADGQMIVPHVKAGASA